MAQTATVEIQMPQMGESVTEGTVLEWHVSEGDAVEEGQTVVEVSTDKVDAEVPAPASGVIRKILVGQDETIEVGKTLAELEPGEAGGDGAGTVAASEIPDHPPAADARASERDHQSGERERAGASTRAEIASTDDASVNAGEPTAEGALQIVMPEMGESVTEGTVLEWHVSEGDAVEEGQTVVEVSTDKVDAEVPAPASGTITRLLAEADATVQVGQVLAEMKPGEDGAKAAAGNDQAVAEPPTAEAEAPAAEG